VSDLKNWRRRPSNQPKKNSRDSLRQSISRRTFSGAEEFTYNHNYLKWTTIIGGTTGEGAHPVPGRRIDDRFMIGVPFARDQPITKTNWEGTGVAPTSRFPRVKRWR
jgi:hypothetical protein